MAAVLPAAKENIFQPSAGLLARLAEKPHPGPQPNEPKLHWADQTAKLHIALGFSTSLYDFRVGPRCSSKERDSETGLDFFQARYFSSAQGRFTSPDEFKGGIVDPFTGQDIETNTALPYADITDPQTLNKYAYVRNNPLRYTDPTGHVAVADDLLEALGVGVAVTYVYLSLPPEQRDFGTAITTVTGTIASWFHKSDSKPGTLGKPDHQQTADEEAQKMGGTREVTIPTPEGEKGSRRADAAKVENGKVTQVTQVYRPTPAGNIPKREKQAAADIEKATGVKPKMEPVRPVRPVKPPCTEGTSCQ